MANRRSMLLLPLIRVCDTRNRAGAVCSQKSRSDHRYELASCCCNCSSTSSVILSCLSSLQTLHASVTSHCTRCSGRRRLSPTRLRQLDPQPIHTNSARQHSHVRRHQAAAFGEPPSPRPSASRLGGRQRNRAAHLGRNEAGTNSCSLSCCDAPSHAASLLTTAAWAV